MALIALHGIADCHICVKSRIIWMFVSSWASKDPLKDSQNSIFHSIFQNIFSIQFSKIFFQFNFPKYIFHSIFQNIFSIQFSFVGWRSASPYYACPAPRPCSWGTRSSCPSKGRTAGSLPCLWWWPPQRRWGSTKSRGWLWSRPSLYSMPGLIWLLFEHRVGICDLLLVFFFFVHET